MPNLSLTGIDQITDTEDPNFELAGATGITTAVIGGTTYVFVASVDDDGIQVLSVSDTGELEAVDQVTTTNALELNGAVDVTTAVVGGTTYLFVTGREDDGVQVFSVGTDGKLTEAGQITDSDGDYVLDGANGVTTAVVDGATYLFVASRDEDGVQVLSVGAGGILEAVDNVTDTDALELDGAVDVVTAEIDGKTFLFVAARDDNGVQVFEVGTGGTLTARGQITDSDGTGLELDGAFSLATAEIDGTTYLFVASYDDNGVQVLKVDSGGNLEAVDQVSDGSGTMLDGAIGVTTTVVDGATYLLVTGRDEDGVQVFSVADDGTLTAGGANRGY